MKKIFLLLSILSLSFGIRAKHIFNVLDYKAHNDGKTITTQHIQQAIDECHKQGGGEVYIPTGEYLVGTINLRSNINLVFQAGATLIATTDLAQYQKHDQALAGVFYTEDCENISITGRGKVFGQGMEFMHKGQKSKEIGLDQKKYTRQKEDFRKVVSQDDGPLYPKDRFHQMIIFSNCKNIILRDFECVDAPFWTFLLAHCVKVTIQGLSIDNNLMIPNSDGIDIISCSNVNMSDCIITCGDDAIVLAGYTEHHGDPGFKKIYKTSSNINVSNCILQSRSSGIRIGGHDQNHMENYNFNNITIYDSNRGINIAVSDTGAIKNIKFSNIHVETRLHTGDWWGQGEPIHITAIQLVPEKPMVGTIENLFFTNVTCVGENSALTMIAQENTNIRNVYFTNFQFIVRESNIEDIAGGNYDLRLNVFPEKELFEKEIPAVYIKNAENVFFNQGEINWEGTMRKYHTHAVEAIDVNTIRLNNVMAKASPSNGALTTNSFVNCKKVEDNTIEE